MSASGHSIRVPIRMKRIVTAIAAAILRSAKQEGDMSLGLILSMTLALALLGVIPAWSHSRG